MARKSTRKSKKETVVEPIEKEVKQPEIEAEIEAEIETTVKEPVETKAEDAVVENSIKDRIKKNAEQFTEKYFKNSECDYRKCGEWQKIYSAMLNMLFKLKDKTVIDIGGAYGAITSTLLPFCKKAINLDISKHVIDRKLFDGVEYVLSSVQNMKKIDDKSVNFVHISHVLNYVDNRDIKRVFSEIARIMDKDAECFIVMELDPTEKVKFKYTVKELETALKSAKLKNITVEYDSKIEKLPKSLNMFKQYKWDYLILKK